MTATLSVRRQLMVTTRLVRLSLVAGAIASSAFIAWRTRLAGDVADLVLAVGAAIGLSPVLHDPASITLASSPTSPWRRVSARLAIAIPCGVACWVIARGSVSWAVLGANDLPMRTLLLPSREAWLVLASMVALVLATEASGSASGNAAGIVGSVVVLLFAAGATLLPERWALLPVADHMVRWFGLLALAGGSAVLATADPGRQGGRRARRENRAGRSARQSVGER